MNKKILKTSTLMLIMLISTAYFTLDYFVSRYFYLDSVELTNNDVENINSTLNKNIEQYSKLLGALSSSIRVNNNNSKLQLLKDLNDNNRYLLNAYYSDADGRVTSSLENGEILDFDGSKRPWFLGAVSNPKEVYMTEPYKDALTPNYVITLSKKITYENNDIGVVAIDLTASSLMAGINDARYIFYLDDGNVWMSDDEHYIGSNVKELNYPLKTNEFNMLEDADNNYSSYKTDGKFGDFIVITDQNDNVKTKKVIIIAAMSFFSFMGVALTFGVIFIVRKETKNLPLIVNWIESLNSGDLSEMKINKSNNELDAISDSLSQLSLTLRTTLSKVNSSMVGINEKQDD
ncbi:hypothetical protein AB4501_22140, partial [Vibrio sp. 10N.222.55.E8]